MDKHSKYRNDVREHFFETRNEPKRDKNGHRIPMDDDRQHRERFHYAENILSTHTFVREPKSNSFECCPPDRCTHNQYDARGHRVPPEPAPAPAKLSRNYDYENHCPLHDTRKPKHNPRNTFRYIDPGMERTEGGDDLIVYKNSGFREATSDRIEDDRQEPAPINEYNHKQYQMKETYPPHKDPYPSHKDPYPSLKDPYPSHKDPYPSHKDPYPSHKDSYPSHKDPYPSHKDPYPPQKDPPQKDYEKARAHCLAADERLRQKYSWLSDDSGTSKKASHNTIISAKSGKDLRSLIRSQIHLQQALDHSLSHIDCRSPSREVCSPLLGDDKKEIDKVTGLENEAPTTLNKPTTPKPKPEEIEKGTEGPALDKFSPFDLTALFCVSADDVVSSKVIEPMIRKIQRMYLNTLEEEMSIMEYLTNVPKMVSEVYREAAQRDSRKSSDFK